MSGGAAPHGSPGASSEDVAGEALEAPNLVDAIASRVADTERLDHPLVGLNDQLLRHGGQ